MLNEKIIIPGKGRAGTTLVTRLLMMHPGINAWLPVDPTDKHDVQPDCKLYIREKWPHVSSDRLFKAGDDWNLVKCPEFALLTRELIDLYPRCKFLVMDRALEERVQSSIRVKAYGWIRKAFEANKGIRDMTCGLMRISEDVLMGSVESQVRGWWFIHDFQLESGLASVKPSRIMRVSFHDLMSSFELTMHEIMTFLQLEQFSGGKAWLDEFVKARKVKYQLGAHPPSYWIERR